MCVCSLQASAEAARILMLLFVLGDVVEVAEYHDEWGYGRVLPDGPVCVLPSFFRKIVL